MRHPKSPPPTHTVALLLALLWPAAAGADPPAQTGFPVTLNGSQVRSGSTALGDLNGDGVLDIVVGALDGKVHAYTGIAVMGTVVKLWEFDTGDKAVEAKPAIADLDADGDLEVVIGAGGTVAPNAHGDLYVIDHLGEEVCNFPTLDTTSPPDFIRDGVFSSPAVADLVPGDGGRLEIAFGSFDRRVRVIEHDCTLVWAKNVFDSVFSSPAIGDVDRDGQLDVVIGSDADMDTPGVPHDGGWLRVYSGDTGEEDVAGFPVPFNEVIWSSPALGDLTGDGWLEIVVGTGHCWGDERPDGVRCPTPRQYPGVGDYLIALDHTGKALPGWPVTVPSDSYAFGSPALGDLDGDGNLEVVFNTTDPDDPQNGLGRVYALEADGTPFPGSWPTEPTTPLVCGVSVRHSSTGASPVLADVTGDDGLEVILPSSFELVVWDRFGTQLTRESCATTKLQLVTSFQVSSSPAVGDVDGDGDLEVVVGGAESGGGTGAIYAWDLDGADVPAALAWPMFRHGAENQATLAGAVIFADGFESGDTSSW